MTKLREAGRARRSLSKDQIRLLNRKATWRIRPLVVAAVHTGARECEILRLRWSDVSFEQRKVANFRSKTGSSDGLDLHPAVEEALMVAAAGAAEAPRRPGRGRGPGLPLAARDALHEPPEELGARRREGRALGATGADAARAEAHLQHALP